MQCFFIISFIFKTHCFIKVLFYFMIACGFLKTISIIIYFCYLSMSMTVNKHVVVRSCMEILSLPMMRMKKACLPVTPLTLPTIADPPHCTGSRPSQLTWKAWVKVTLISAHFHTTSTFPGHSVVNLYITVLFHSELLEFFYRTVHNWFSQFFASLLDASKMFSSLVRCVPADELVSSAFEDQFDLQKK